MKYAKGRSVLATILAMLAGLVVITVQSLPANAADLTCSSGTYNQRLTTTGACAWGNVNGRSSGVTVYADIYMVVVDNANDGHGAYMHYRLCKTGICGNYVTAGSTNGYNTSSPAIKENIAVAGTLQIRVCAGSASCSSWKTAVSAP